MGEVEEVVGMATNSGNNNIIYIIVLLLVASVFILENIKKFKELLGLKGWHEIQEEEQSKEITDLKNEVNTIKTEVDYIRNTQSSIKDVIDKLDADLTYMQNKQDATNRSRIKDRISQAYRYYKEKGQWTRMEQEALNDLISSYEAAGGSNSFVHDIVLPASLNWEIVDQ